MWETDSHHLRKFSLKIHHVSSKLQAANWQVRHPPQTEFAFYGWWWWLYFFLLFFLQTVCRSKKLTFQIQRGAILLTTTKEKNKNKNNIKPMYFPIGAHIFWACTEWKWKMELSHFLGVSVTDTNTLVIRYWQSKPGKLKDLWNLFFVCFEKWGHRQTVGLAS